MKRVPEPELMESQSQVRAYSEADFSESDSKIISGVEKYLFESQRELGENSRIIDLGCGPGNISERLSLRWPKSRVIGIDGSKQMIREAERRKQEVDFKDNCKKLSYQLISIRDIAFGNITFPHHFDLVVSNSLLHHIHQVEDFWHSLKRLSGESTIHFHRDLRRPNSEYEAINLCEKYLPCAPSVLRNDFLASLKAAFEVEEIQKQFCYAGLSQFKVFEVDEIYLEVVGTI